MAEYEDVEPEPHEPEAEQVEPEQVDGEPVDGESGPWRIRLMENEAKRALEAIIMVSEQPADPALLAQLVELSPIRVEELCEELAAAYENDDRGFRLTKVGGGWRFESHPDLHAYVERFVLTGQTARLSAAALETLAIVAYKQPISRAQITAIRGVNADGVMRTLQQRGYVDEVGRDPGPGQAVMYGTTPLFLERLGLNGLDELPSLGDFVPGPDVVELLEHGLRVDRDDEVAAPAEDTPGGDAPIEDAPIEDAPIEDAPIEDAPIGNAPVEDAPIASGPPGEAPDGASDA